MSEREYIRPDHSKFEGLDLAPPQAGALGLIRHIASLGPQCFIVSACVAGICWSVSRTSRWELGVAASACITAVGIVGLALLRNGTNAKTESEIRETAAEPRTDRRGR